MEKIKQRKGIARIYLSSLALYVEGRENGRWLQLPMGYDDLKKVYNEIVGADQEHIILDYKAAFEIDEFMDVFDLNEIVTDLDLMEIECEEKLQILCEYSQDMNEIIKALNEHAYTIINVNEVSKNWCSALDGEELYGMILEACGYNSLFTHSIPYEMIDYIDFAKVFTCLSINDGWEAVKVNDTTYLVRM